ncbi:ATP-binding protein [Ornithinimicrobium sp. Y1694]|uniref:ATP-binding protein n=1 Tax=Ornithinimicrobium sp. Y1694 TaxID=3418590 RepID=UPI003CF636ED
MSYVRRALDNRLDRLVDVAPAIAIEGAKGVGKTATARERVHQTWWLDRAAHRSVLQADPSLDLFTDGPVLLDEWQRVPEVWDAVRRQVDAGAPPGRFLLTGSATSASGEGTHSGAGRIVSLRMRPMALFERPGSPAASVSLASLLEGEHALPSRDNVSPLALPDYLTAITESGFPGIRGREQELRDELLDAYLLRVVDRDLPELGFGVRRPETLRRWLAAYAAASSTTASYSAILDATTAGDGSQPAKTTTIVYRDHLTQLFLLDPVPGWQASRNPLGRLQQAPKHQLVDPALTARLLRLSAHSLGSPRGAHLAGPLFEALATLSVRAAAQVARAHVGHLRSRNGDREIDLIVEGPDGQVLGVEVKLAGQVDDKDVRHLLWLREVLPDDVVDLMVLTTGDRAYRRRDGVAVVPLALLGA